MKQSRLLWLLLPALAVLLTGAGITYAWFSHNSALSTLMNILPPDQITIVPIDEDGGAGLDLDFREGVDIKDKDGTIHIYRPVCIKSTSLVHQLEIVHTTNLAELSFQIYPTKQLPNGSVVKPSETAAPINGEYKNRNKDTKLAEEQILDNYLDTKHVADVHAYPLYWLAENSESVLADNWQDGYGWPKVVSYPNVENDPTTGTEKTFYYTYYYLEISWKEDRKETDLFYVMAQNIHA